jgi:hypothetical protein
VFLSDASVVAINAGFHELLRFDSAGRFMSRWGGAGGGPGEFRDIWSLSVGASDSLYVYDARERRMSVFDRSGTLGRVVRLQGLDSLGWPHHVGALGTGQIVGGFPSRVPGVGLVRDTLLVVTFGSTGSADHVVARVPHAYTHWGPHTMPGSGETGMFPLPVPFSGLAALALGFEDIYIGDPASGAITRIGPDGGRLVTVLGVARERLTEAHRDALFGSLSPRMRGPEFDVLRTLRGPDHLPAFGQEALTARVSNTTLVLSDSGEVWVQPFRLSDSLPGSWLRVDRDGRVIGSVVVPAAFRPTDVRGEFVLGVFTLADGTEELRAYSVRPPP